MSGPANHRWVCGALGRRNESEYQRLRQRIGAPFDPIVASVDVILHARGELATWAVGDARGWCWGPPIAHTPIGSWRDAVAVSSGAGLSVGRAEAILHLDASGVVPVFIYRGDGYILFASSVDALAASVERKLHVDWAAWGEILSCAAVLGQRTPFEEISRLAPSTAVSFRGGRLRFEELPWHWAENTPEMPASIENATDRIIEAVTDGIGRVAADRLIVPLSGGWDSRLLSAVAARARATTETATLPASRGRDEELDWAHAVARQLGLGNTILDAVEWDVGFGLVAEQVSHLTSLHFWLWPLAKWLEDRDGVVLDGLAGGVLLKNAFITEEVLGGTEAPYRFIAAKLATRLKPDELLTAPFVASAQSHVAEVFRSEWGRWADHPAAATLVVYRLRTLGGIVLSPMMLLAGSAAIAMPFVQPDVAALTLSIDPRWKAGGRFYSSLLARLDASLVAIPSTNDTKPKQLSPTRPDLTPEAVGEVARLLQHEFVAPLLGVTLAERLEADQLANVVASRHGRRVVHGLALFAGWFDRHASRLIDADSAQWSRTQARSARAGDAATLRRHPGSQPADRRTTPGDGKESRRAPLRDPERPDMQKDAGVVTIGPRKIAAVVVVVMCAAALGVSYAAIGVVGPLVIVGLLQVAAILAILEVRVALRRHVDNAAAKLDRRSSKLERRLSAHIEAVKRERERMGELREEERQDLARQLEADREKVAGGIRRTRREVMEHTTATVGDQYRQLEALLALYHDLQPKEAFPPLKRWAAAPDLLHYAYRRITMDRPSQILELGSGVSTLVIAYALEKTGQGRVVALEQSEQFWEVTSTLLTQHGLLERVDLRLARLQPIELEGESYLWYATEALPEGPVDFVFVDGPPGNTQTQARYPALPLVYPRLSDKATVVLDDCDREDETRIAARWTERYPDLMRHDLRHEKGTLVLERV